jgi:hypothetical protein
MMRYMSAASILLKDIGRRMQTASDGLNLNGTRLRASQPWFGKAGMRIKG